MRSHKLPLREDVFVWALGSLSRCHRRPFEADLVLQQYPPPYDLEGFILAAQALGFKTGLKKVKAETLHRLALPCGALLKPGSESLQRVPTGSQFAPLFGQAHAEPTTATTIAGEQAPPLPTFGLALVLKADTERVLFVEAGSTAPTVLSCAEFSERYAGQALQVSLKAQALPEDLQAGEPEAPFGFAWFIPELLKYKAIWRDVLLASLVIQLMALATPLFTQVVIDKVVVHHTQSTLTVIGIVLVMFMLFTAVMTWIRQYLVLHTGNRVDAVLGIQVFEHLFKLPTRYFEHRPTGVVVARLHAVEQIREFVSGAAVTLLLDCPFLLIFLGLMFYYSVPLSLVSLAILGLIVGLSFAVSPRLRKRLNEQFLLGARQTAFVTEYIAGFETVKSLQMEPQISQRYAEQLATYLHAGFKTKQLANTYNAAAHSLEQLLSLTILCVGAYLVMTRTDFAIGMLVAFQMFTGRLSQPLLRLAGLWQQFQQAHIAIKRLGDVMNAPADPYSLIPTREGGGAGQVEIKNLAFRYAEHLPYLYRGLNLSLKPGAALGLMGPSGCGKSTLAKLLQGFYQPSDGQILIDGRDIRYLSANELRQHFGVVPQETVLFSGTLYDNLVLGNPRASFEEVIGACKMAEIHAVIEQLPQGYRTEIGERGSGLSGRQRQRLAIARALLKRPNILIFDEATSNLDPLTAEHFAKTINALKGQVTLLYIAHQVPKGLQLDGIVRLGMQGTPQDIQQVA